MSMEIFGASNTDFVGTDVSPYGCSRDGVAAASREQETGSREQELGFVILSLLCEGSCRLEW